MKNMIELPTREDFHRTKNFEVTNDVAYEGVQKTHIRKCNVAMRSIIDFTSIELQVITIDKEKMPEYEKLIKQWRENFGEAQMRGQHFYQMQPLLPTKTEKIIGTLVSYLTGAQRIIVDDFEEFEELYFNYLNKQKLDI